MSFGLRKKLKMSQQQDTNESAEETKSAINLVEDQRVIPNVSTMCQSPAPANDIFPGGNVDYSAAGTKTSLHGNIYQLKLLMLVLYRAVKYDYNFRLASEMVAAEKFDDLVFQYVKQDEQGNSVLVHRFLQAKHKQDETKPIDYEDLVAEDTKSKFGLAKYFDAYRKIKQKPEFKGELQDFIICTNIDIDLEALEKAEITLKQLNEPDNLLDIKNFEKAPIESDETDDLPVKKNSLNMPKRYKLNVDKQHVLYQKLKETSELYFIAKELVKSMRSKDKNLELKSLLLKTYHTALAQQVIDAKTGTFFPDFIAGNAILTESAKDLRKFMLHMLAAEEFPKDFKFTLSHTFNNANLTKEADFIQKLTAYIRDASNNVVEVIKGKEITENINKLIGYVLVKNCEKIQFNTLVLQYFENGNDKLLNELPGNLKDFIKKLKAALETEAAKKIELNTLKAYEFKIENFQTCAEDERGRPALPCDKVDDAEIDEFFAKLIFAVNQPNEIELGNIISKEIGKEYNLIDSALFADHIQRKILDWLKAKGEKGSEGTFLTKQHGVELFEETRLKIIKSALVLSKLVYEVKIKEFGIKYTEQHINELPLQGFLLDQKNAKVFHLVTAHIPLSAIKVYQVLEGMSAYKQDDSFIFTTLESLLRLQEYVIKAFQATNLLIIECKDDNFITEKQLKAVYEQLISINLKRDKKIILIAKQANALTKLFSNETKLSTATKVIWQDKNAFTDLTADSQAKLRKACKIKFQGYEISLANILDEATEKLLDAELLVQLINKNEVNIAEPLRSLGEIENYFIPRTFNYQTEIRTEIFKANEKDLFALSGMDEISLSNLVAEAHEMCLFGDYNANKPNTDVKFILLDDAQAATQFRQLQQQLQAQQLSIHWLKRQETGQLMWQQSHGSITKLYKYIRTGRKYTQHYEETEFLQQIKADKVVIIADTAGMGKTTILTKLAQSIKEADPSLWLVRIDLNDYTQQLKAQSEKTDFKKAANMETEVAMRFLEKDLLNFMNPAVEKTLFQYYTHKMILIFDGFDEICPNYKALMLHLMQALKNSTIKQIFIATRPQAQKELEAQLMQFAYTLNRFTEANQTEFLSKYWQQQLKLTAEQEKRLKDYAQLKIETLKNTDYASVPLQTRIIAVAFEQDILKWHKSNEAELLHLPKAHELSDLYARFFSRKFDIYLSEKTKLDFSKPALERQALYQKFIAQHQMLALFTLFDDEKRKKLQTAKFLHEFGQQNPNLAETTFQNKKFKNTIQTKKSIASLVKDKEAQLEAFINDIKAGKYNTGIIDQFIEHKPHFIHRTFAEYLVAIFFVTSLESESIFQIIFEDMLLQHDFQLTRTFFDKELKANLSPKTTVICEKYLNNLWKSKADSRLYNAHGRTMLHLAADEGNLNIIKFLFDLLQKNKTVLSDLLHGTTKDSQKETALHLATKKNHLDIVELLVEKQNEDISTADSYGETVLHIAAQEGNAGIIRYLLEKGAKVNAANNYGEMVLHSAVGNGNLNIIEQLVASGADVNGVDKHGETILHKAAQNDSLEIIKWLVRQGADFNAANRNGEPALHIAVRYGNLASIAWLIQQGANVNAANKYGETALHIATRNGKLDVVKCLVENGADFNAANRNGEIIFHIAARHGNLGIVRCLVENGVDVNAADRNGEPVLHIAARYGSLEIVKCLVENEADVNAADRNGEPVLHIAARYGNLKIFQCLVENGADVNAADRNGEPILHETVRYGNLKMVECLVDNKADVNAADRNGEPVLHIAARNGNLDIIKCLVERDADFNAGNKYGETVLNIAAQHGYIDIMRYLVEKGANVNQLNEYDREVLLAGLANRRKELM